MLGRWRRGLRLFEFLGLRRAPEAVGVPTVAGRPPRLPDGVRVYAIGDVHGCLDLLEGLEAAILEDASAPGAPATAYVVGIGDYVDRGPDSRGVLERLTAPLPGGLERILLCGNHDLWLRDFLVRRRCDDDWIEHGGIATLASYGVEWRPRLPRPQRIVEAHGELLHAVPGEHRRLLAGLRLIWSIGDYVFCHAGVDPTRPMDQQRAEDLLWIREPFLSWRSSLEGVVVHGHTATPAPDIRPHRIGIDTGAVWTGCLTCLVLEGDGHRFLTALRG